LPLLVQQSSAGAGGITGVTARAPPEGTSRAFPERLPEPLHERKPESLQEKLLEPLQEGLPEPLHEGLQLNLLQEGKWDLLHLPLFLFQPDQGLVIYSYYKENDTYMHKVCKLEVL
uniref:Uncharacterized protein n=1 Tax=Amphimedon queenslandica TaxID=400682 RepID=A0A1X7VBG9_AMPQE